MVKSRSRKSKASKGKGAAGEAGAAAAKVPREIRRAVDTGKVVFGARRGALNAASGGAKLLILAVNCPKRLKETVENYCKSSGTQYFEFDGSSVELGSLCGKPFPVAVLSVLEPGNSSILELAGKK